LLAGWIARNANKLGHDPQALGEVFAGTGSRTVKMYHGRSDLLGELEKSRLPCSRFACTTCNGMSGARIGDFRKKVR